MSRFIDDDELEQLAHNILDGNFKATEKARIILETIRQHRAYIALAECSCEKNQCVCYLPFEPKPLDIQAGDAFRQITPNGREMTLVALGVRRPSEGSLEIFTAGWPPMIVRIPDHGRVELVRKGKGITKAELRHRRDRVGGKWEDGL